MNDNHSKKEVQINQRPVLQNSPGPPAELLGVHGPAPHVDVGQGPDEGVVIVPVPPQHQHPLRPGGGTSNVPTVPPGQASLLYLSKSASKKVTK